MSLAQTCTLARPQLPIPQLAVARQRTEIEIKPLQWLNQHKELVSCIRIGIKSVLTD